MEDRIIGPVTNIVDGDTFDMEVTEVWKNNVYHYNKQERIRIADIDAPELQDAGGKRSKESLEKKISGYTVECTIQTRDDYGRLVASYVNTNPPKI